MLLLVVFGSGFESRFYLLISSLFLMEYNIFRDELAIRYPARGHALWDPSRDGLDSAVQVGDVGFVREGKFIRLFNILLPRDHPSHENFGVPEHHSVQKSGGMSGGSGGKQ
jgi:hypothetical protein